MGKRINKIFAWVTGDKEPDFKTDYFVDYSETDLGDMLMVHERSKQLRVFKAKKSDLPEGMKSPKGYYVIQLWNSTRDKFIPADKSSETVEFERPEHGIRKLSVDGQDLYTLSEVKRILEEWKVAVYDDHLGCDLPKPIFDDFNSFRKADKSNSEGSPFRNRGIETIKPRVRNTSRRPS